MSADESSQPPEFQSPSGQPLPQPPDKENEVADYEAASHSTADYIKNIVPMRAQKTKRRKKRVILVVVILLLIGGGVGAYLKFSKPTKKQEPAQQSASTQPNIDTETAKLERHISQDLKLSLDYPDNWQIETGTVKLKLTSPITKLSSGNGESTDGNVVLTILGAGSDPVGFQHANGKAALDSEKFAYSSPTQNQRQETFLSFVGFMDGNIDAMYITGDSGYKQGDAVPEADVAKVEPVISLTFVKCTGTTCEEPLSLSKDAWKNDSMLQTAKSILQSLTID